MVALKREQADMLGHDGERYDALLEGYEPGMRTAQVEPMFAALTVDSPSSWTDPRGRTAAGAPIRRENLP